MSSRLIDRVRVARSSATARRPEPPTRHEFERIKKQLHSELIESLDFEQVSQARPGPELATPPAEHAHRRGRGTPAAR